ncbi:DUF6089 family protein [Maribellus sp. YY47]|uniref:type IX secretion system protein PorG n=1 Tax=Maribellus sp. YY47 TaxID=2929486 RepID=UPI00200143A6|nr:DUF6089 family protein [Maribellus sp. YY47]MCK3685065.1 DUF6089 family protein [Maribellus sp. YY47]
MKKLALVFAVVLITTSGHAQKTVDIGIWGGSSTVWGDMDDNSAFETFNLNVGAYFRYNFNARVALRAMFLTGNMSREGAVEEAPWDFDKSAQDLTLQVEINYLKYILGRKKLRFSPYVTAGLGVSYFTYTFRPEEIYAFNPEYPMLQYDGSGNLIVPDPAEEESEVVPTIPFGFGFKYSVSERLGVGVEYQMRKYMSDRLDDLDDPLAHENETGVVSYNQGSHNNDWIGYLGVHLTYKIYIGKKICPAYESK